MKEAFVDLDENDLKFIDIELPPDLSKLIELDGETGELKINKNVQSMGELPKGINWSKDERQLWDHGGS